MKRLVATITTLIMILAAFTFGAADVSAAANPTVTYKVAGTANGSGTIDIKTADKTVRLENNGDNATFPNGTAAAALITANLGSVIREVKINGEQMGEDINAKNIGFNFESITDDVTIEVTYEQLSYQCSSTTEGRGNVTVEIPDYYNDNNHSVFFGDRLVYHVQAEEGYEILAVYLDDQELDLAIFGKTPTNKIDNIDLAIQKVTSTHKLFVEFSGANADTTETFNLTVSYDSTRGICNNGIAKETVEFGTSYKISIAPYEGYKVDKIIDGNDVITNFTDDYYTVQNITTNRAVMVIFGIDDSKKKEVEVGAKRTAEPADETKTAEVTYGDANLDGKVNVVDVTVVQKGVAGLVSFNAEQMKNADVDGDGQITVKDATLIQKKVAMIVSEFPVC